MNRVTTMFYELWDVRSGNIINTYDTEAEALDVVRQLVALNGLDYYYNDLHSVKLRMTRREWLAPHRFATGRVG